MNETHLLLRLILETITPIIVLMESFANQVADSILDQFNALPAKCKPVRQEAGGSSWVPLSGIVVARGKR